jgi:hypothetical protein
MLAGGAKPLIDIDASFSLILSVLNCTKMFIEFKIMLKIFNKIFIFSKA